MKLTGRWFPQIVDRDSGNLYPIYITKIVVLVSEPVRGRSRATELPCFSLWHRIPWSTLSNAFAKSRYMTSTLFPISTIFNILS